MTNLSQQGSNALAGLLRTHPIVQVLRDMQPPLKGETLESRAISASVIAGYLECILNLEALASAQNNPAPSSPYVKNLEEFEQRGQTTNT